jgi:hypothetical protein
MIRNRSRRNPVREGRNYQPSEGGERRLAAVDLNNDCAVDIITSTNLGALTFRARSCTR